MQEVSYIENNETKMDLSSSDEDFETENLPDLIVEKCEVNLTEGLTGRRVVDINHVMNQLVHLVNHSKQCTMGKYEYEKEIVEELYSKFIFYCDQCKKYTTVTSEPNATKHELNDGLVWGALSIGIGYDQVEEMFSVMNVPIMGRNKFRAHEKKIGKVIILPVDNILFIQYGCYLCYLNHVITLFIYLDYYLNCQLM